MKVKYQIALSMSQPLRFHKEVDVANIPPFNLEMSGDVEMDSADFLQYVEVFREVLKESAESSHV